MELVKGNILTAQGLLGLLDAVAEERNVAGKAPRMALVDAFQGLDFQTGKSTFKDARKVATEAAGGDTSTSRHKRLSEAHAIFTALRLADVSPDMMDGLGWSPAVDFCRGALDAHGFTVAGNPRKSDDERDAERAQRETDSVNARAIEHLPPNATPEQIAQALKDARAARAEEQSTKTIPEAVVAIGKALATISAELSACEDAEGHQRKAWLALPSELRASLLDLFTMSDSIVAAGVEIATVRKVAGEQQAAQRKAEAELKAAKQQQQKVKAAA